MLFGLGSRQRILIRERAGGRRSQPSSRTAKPGSFCITPSNLHSDWLLFEAGALSKSIENTYVCPFLIEVEPADVKLPLGQFQATRATKADVLKLLRTLNTALGESALPVAHIDEIFDVCWPLLESKLQSLPAEESGQPPKTTERDMRDMLDEILASVRNLNRAV
jgi:hypothetical protein